MYSRRFSTCFLILLSLFFAYFPALQAGERERKIYRIKAKRLNWEHEQLLTTYILYNALKN